MSLRAVFFDFGGVLVRTEFQAPREQLAERLGLDYEALCQRVFESESGRRASVGELSGQGHWESLARSFGRPAAEWEPIKQEFFAGDIVDRELLDFVRSLRPRCRIGLISNAWDDLREYIARERFDDAFDAMIISAEVRAMKPGPRIFQIALDKFGVEPAQAAFVDDLPENIAGCEAVGMHGILFRSPEQTRQDLNLLLNA